MSSMETEDVEVICRQTNYTEEQATVKLKELGTVESVIMDYLAVKPREVSRRTTNQMIYGEIRSIMKRPS